MVAIFNPVLSVVTLRKIDYNALFMVSDNVCQCKLDFEKVGY
jgi:hypothetical protein